MWGWGDWTRALLFKFSKCLIKYHSVAATSAGVARRWLGSTLCCSIQIEFLFIHAFCCTLHTPLLDQNTHTETHTHKRAHMYALCTVVVTFIHSWRSGHAGGPSYSASLSLWTHSASKKFVWHFHGVCQGAQVSVTLKCRCTHTHTHMQILLVCVCVCCVSPKCALSLLCRCE